MAWLSMGTDVVDGWNGFARRVVKQPFVGHDEREQIAEFELAPQLKSVLKRVAVRVVCNTCGHILSPRMHRIGDEIGHEIGVVVPWMLPAGSIGFTVPVDVIDEFVVVPARNQRM